MEEHTYAKNTWQRFPTINRARLMLSVCSDIERGWLLTCVYDKSFEIVKIYHISSTNPSPHAHINRINPLHPSLILSQIPRVYKHHSTLDTSFRSSTRLASVTRLTVNLQYTHPLWRIKETRILRDTLQTLISINTHFRSSACGKSRFSVQVEFVQTNKLLPFLNYFKIESNSRWFCLVRDLNPESWNLIV